ncbi:hypothetical protein [Parapedobacter koreensis]|uniref:Uncharacterized protein n=1 Tax=Parapedobacter koreensis TaxID=332977 RepID=A0A1H7S034_9SPHI|nr:hypothetical protein [Parapedobacter koreensis]SEL65852.1 hypothetical protein SAMN05421740_1081 [Parapedobacter koreensis]
MKHHRFACVVFGFTMLFSAPQQEETVNETKQIDLNSGFYIQEQNYAKLARKALELGFKLVSYENTDNTKEREMG